MQVGHPGKKMLHKFNGREYFPRGTSISACAPKRRLSHTIDTIDLLTRRFVCDIFEQNLRNPVRESEHERFGCPRAWSSGHSGRWDAPLHAFEV